MEKVLLIDSREPLIFAERIAEVCPIPISIEQLDTGDFVCEDICIERKEISDLAASIIDKRLFTQCERMQEQFPDGHYLLIHGKLEDVTVRINPHAIIGAIAKMASLGTRVIWVCFDNEEHLIYLILKILEWNGKLVMIKPKKAKKAEEGEEDPPFFKMV